MTRFLSILAVLILASLPARAEEIVLGLSKAEVAITANFDGSELLIFGAIKRDAPAPDTGELGVIVTVAGPNVPVTVRRKERRLGIWVNTESMDIEVAPSFYAVASNRPLETILSDAEDLDRQISLRRAIRSLGPSQTDHINFAEALMRIREGKGLYQSLPDGVWVRNETLFRSSLTMPANLTEGDYRIEIYLTRGGEIVDIYNTSIPVTKVGLERWLYNLAHEHAVLYGLMSLAIAIAAGWSASAVFTLMRR